jgi:hypothetical protein
MEEYQETLEFPAVKVSCVTWATEQCGGQARDFGKPEKRKQVVVTYPIYLLQISDQLCLCWFNLPDPGVPARTLPD